jgi:hypothetical protein
MAEEPTVLSEALTSHTLTLFVGADLPHEMTGLPRRAELAHELARRKRLDESLSLAEVAQRVSQASNRWEFTDFIRNALDTTGKPPQPFHQRVVTLVKEHQIETIITAAYDNLLELAFQQAGMGINRVVRGSDVSFINPDRPTLIKLYGDAQQPDTLVVTDRDHSDLLRDRDKEALVDEVRRTFRRNTMLFLGYNLADPDFRFLFDQVAENRFARTGYAVWPGLPEADVKMWRDRGIVILDTDPFGILSGLATSAPNAMIEGNEVGSAKETLYLGTTATLFGQWLADYTRVIPYRDFPTEKGRLVLQSIKPPLSIQSPITLEMDTIYITPKGDEDAEVAWPVGAAITLRLVPLSTERVEVQAECRQSVIFGYFHELLAAVKQRWPQKEIAAPSEASAMPARLPDITEIPPDPWASTGGKDMNYERGLGAFKQAAEGANWYQDFAVHEAALRDNLQDERRYGPSEQTRRDRTRIVDQLNALALKHLGVSFNDLCLGKQPAFKMQPTPDNHEVIERLRRIEAKLDQGRAEDRQAATQILDAIAQNRIEQAEATQTVAELQAWAQAVQQAGLPLNPELRAALGALSEHTGSAYQYLQLALPIIPGILSYNVELGSQHQLDLKAILGRLKDRLGKGAKGDGLASGSTQPVLNTGKAWAVLVGINHYEDAHIAGLKVCVDDVAAIHQALAGSYQVAKLLTDATPDRLPTRANILGELSTIAQTAGEGDLLLFYFSGHGVAEKGESYLLARDTRLTALKHTAIAMRDVRELIGQSPARAKVIVLDACHSGASIGKAETIMTPEFIQHVFEEAEGMAVLASCKQGQRSWEWPERKRSVFTYYLLEALNGKADLDRKKFVTVSDANRYVTDGVKSWAAQNSVPQTPTLQYTVAGDIILSRYTKPS